MNLREVKFGPTQQTLLSIMLMTLVGFILGAVAFAPAWYNRGFADGEYEMLTAQKTVFSRMADEGYAWRPIRACEVE